MMLAVAVAVAAVPDQPRSIRKRPVRPPPSKHEAHSAAVEIDPHRALSGTSWSPWRPHCASICMCRGSQGNSACYPTSVVASKDKAEGKRIWCSTMPSTCLRK